MSFDTPIDRRGTDCAKWDQMESLYGVSPASGLAMWVADMDFRPPQVVQEAVERMAAHGVYGYYGAEDAYKAAIAWWMQSRHGWTVAPEAIFSTHGLVNGVGMSINTWTEPGDEIILFTPVYHAFARVIKAAGRKVVECPLALVDGRYEMDFEAYDAQVTPKTKMVILCSPHNPGGRVWTRTELQGVADFVKRHDLLLVSDEIHHDLVYPGAQHIPMPLVDPEMSDRLVMLTAASKTFNIAGCHIGNVIVEDPKLRAEFYSNMRGHGMSANSFGLAMVTAAYSPKGAAWVDELVAYLDGNRKLFDQGIAEIPGLRSMPLEATYLSWVDFSGTGMSRSEFTARVEKTARIAANHGPSFGQGGENFLRFNIGTQRSIIQDAIARLKEAFSDLQ